LGCKPPGVGMDEVDQRILKYFKEMGPDYAWLVSLRVELPYAQARDRLEALRLQGLIERVPGRIVEYRHRRRLKSTKHRNHTYYDLTRAGKALLREMEASSPTDLNLTFPYKR